MPLFPLAHGLGGDPTLTRGTPIAAQDIPSSWREALLKTQTSSRKTTRRDLPSHLKR